MKAKKLSLAAFIEEDGFNIAFMILLFGSAIGYVVYTESDSYQEKQCLKITDKVEQAECLQKLWLIEKYPKLYNFNNPTCVTGFCMSKDVEKVTDEEGIVIMEKGYTPKSHDELYCMYNPTDEEKCECEESHEEPNYDYAIVNGNVVILAGQTMSLKMLIKEQIFNNPYHSSNDYFRFQIVKCLDCSEGKTITMFPRDNDLFIQNEPTSQHHIYVSGKLYSDNLASEFYETREVCTKAKPKQALAKLEQKETSEKTGCYSPNDCIENNSLDGCSKLDSCNSCCSYNGVNSCTTMFCSESFNSNLTWSVPNVTDKEQAQNTPQETPYCTSLKQQRLELENISLYNSQCFGSSRWDGQNIIRCDKLKSDIYIGCNDVGQSGRCILPCRIDPETRVAITNYDSRQMEQIIEFGCKGEN